MGVPPLLDLGTLGPPTPYDDWTLTGNVFGRHP